MGPLIRSAAIWLCIFLLFSQAPVASAETVTGRVSWVHDGDTIQVDGIGTVRLLGIDAPEKAASSRDIYYWRHHRIGADRLRQIARKALQFNISQLKGKQVRLEFDRTREDKFGRTLAYVYLDEQILFNRLLLEQGLAAVYRRFDFSRRDEFLAAEALAKKAGSGLWAR